MALTRVKGNLQRIFDKSLTDMVRGIRNNRDNEGKYIAQCMEEIKQELKQESASVKANAVAKLTYLQMLGYDISWASFNVIEVMSSPKFTFKRIGYLAASQCFNENTEVLMLTTNMIRKDLNSSTLYDAGLALGGLACFVTPDLARDLAQDVVTLLTSSKPYIRKKAVLLLYKVFLRYPDALRPTFPRLKEKLEDPDPGVQSAAVNVICELARKNPKNYLSLAPMFFKLMTTSSNNWMLIKIIKLFGALTPLEPRLGKKLIEPLTNLINSTSAMSLLYECINTVIAVLISVSSGVPGDHTASIQLCVQKLSILIEDSDQNLKYLGLLAMGRILQTHPKAVQAHKDLVLNCLDDKDESIRLRALDLIYGMVSKKNIQEIVQKLMTHVEKAEGTAYRDELLSKIVDICSHNNYQYVTNFEWYISVLVELTKVEGTKHGSTIAQQMLDVAVRVQSIRHFAVSQMALLIENAHVLLSGVQRSNISEVLYAAAWICGEYSENLKNPLAVLESLLKTRIAVLPGHIQSIYVQNIAKLYSRVLVNYERDEDWDDLESLDNLMLSKMPQFELSEILEVQERACSILELLKEIEALHKNHEKVAEELELLFDGDLNPIAPKAQRKVPVPQGLDLDSWINEPPAEEQSSDSEPEATSASNISSSNHYGGSKNVKSMETGDNLVEPKRPAPTPDELEKFRVAREAEMATNPNYLKSSAKRPSAVGLLESGRISEGSVMPIELTSPLSIPGIVGLDKFNEQQDQTVSWKKPKKGKKSKKGKKDGKQDAEEVVVQPAVIHEVNRGGELPEGARSTDDETEDPREPGADPYKALDINLDDPLRDDERLPIPHHRITSPNEEGNATAVSPTPPLPRLPSLEEEKGKKKHKKVKGEKKLPNEDTKKKTKKSKKEKGKAVEIPVVPPVVEDDLIGGFGDPVVNDVSPSDMMPPVQTVVTVSDVNSTENDLDFWLSSGTNNSTAISDSTPKKVTSDGENPIVENTAPAGEHTKKSKKSKKEKDVSSSGKKRKKRNEKDLDPSTPAKSSNGLAVHDRSEYEVASGICTPSQEQSEIARDQGVSPAPPAATEFTACKLLALNKHVEMKFETNVNLMDRNGLSCKIIFRNLAKSRLSKIEFSVLDTMSAKLVRMPGDSQYQGVMLGFDLLPSATQEAQFAFSIDDLTLPQRLRGTLGYMVHTDTNAIPEKLDFSLKFPCISFLVATTSSPDAFTELLASGDLNAKNSTTFECNDDFAMVLAKLCFYSHVSVVEQVDSSASVYAQTIQSDPVCLLVKLNNGNLQIDGKSTNNQLLQYVLQEIKDVFIPVGDSPR